MAFTVFLLLHPFSRDLAMIEILPNRWPEQQSQRDPTRNRYAVIKDQRERDPDRQKNHHPKREALALVLFSQMDPILIPVCHPAQPFSISSFCVFLPSYTIRLHYTESKGRQQQKSAEWRILGVEWRQTEAENRP
jgi:hypothetical protein